MYKFLHIPVQSGNNEVLKVMRRKYTREQYLEIVDKFKKAIPGITIATVVEIIGGLFATLMIGLAALVYYRDELPSDALLGVLVLIPVCFLAMSVLIRVSAHLLKKMGTSIEERIKAPTKKGKAMKISTMRIKPSSTQPPK